MIWRLFLAFALALFGLHAQAAMGPTSYTQLMPGGGFKWTSTPTGVNFSTPSPRTYTGTGTGVTIVEPGSVATRGGPMGVTATSTADKALAGAAIAAAITGNPVIGAAVAAVSLFNAARVLWDAAKGAWTQDEGVSGALSPCWGPPGLCEPSGPAAILKIGAERYPSHRSYEVVNCVTNAPGDMACDLYGIGDKDLPLDHPLNSGPTARSFKARIGVTTNSGTRTTCTDGVSAPGADGRCPTGTYTPATPAQIAPKLAAQSSDKLADAIKAINQAGGTVEFPAPTLSGPSETPPEVVTETGPDGTVTTKTTRQQVTYEGDTINFGPVTTVTNVTNNATNVNQTTTTTTNNNGGSTTATASECAKNPEALGCLKLGTPPDDKVPTATKDVPYTPESVNLGAACPPDIPILGHSISMAPACSTAELMAPFVRAVGALAALMICVAAIRGQS